MAAKPGGAGEDDGADASPDPASEAERPQPMLRTSFWMPIDGSATRTRPVPVTTKDTAI